MSEFDLKLVPGLRHTGYVHARGHALLAEDAHRRAGPNIGRDGENLTITFLSLNRAALSVRLIASIREHLPKFAGEVLVIDNGSDPAELQSVRDACAALSGRWRIVELGENYGVAGGRNRTQPHVQTDWFMCLDNDIYFRANPVQRIQRDIALLGCHFLNLPLLNPDGATLFSLGGHLYLSLESGKLYIGAGSACPQEARNESDQVGFLSTFLFGGASVLNRHTFEQVGGYDESMFIGFEDIDFSIRLFRAGLKVGNTCALALIHDHPPPASGADLDYEKRRFSREAIRRSADYLESKHGMAIWSDAVDAWLRGRHDELGIGEGRTCEPAGPLAAAEARQRPRVALVLDTENWAFGNISRQLCRHLSDRFEFRMIPMDVVDNIVQVLLMARDCDIVHFFWREHLRLIDATYYRHYVEDVGAPFERFFENIVRPRAISTAVYDHLLLSDAELRERAPLYTGLLDGYSVGSEKLRRIYAAQPDYPPPTAVLTDGVDPELFHPRRLERLDELDKREWRIGWTGNSAWAAELEDFKGVNSILTPAIEQLRAEGLPIRAHFADRAAGPMIPHEKMVDYYAQIDVYVCTSKIEGTPNPVLEAMACGVPVISTDVGIVPEAFGVEQKRFILAERSIECLQRSLRKLVAQPHLARKLSAENLESISAWTWQRKTRPFAEFFERLLQRRAGRLHTTNREVAGV